MLQAAAAASVVAGGLIFIVAPLQGTFSGSLFDFHAYLGGAQAAAHHANIYAVFEQQLSNPQLGGFDYPPVVAWMLEPLTWLPARAASLAWLWLMLACTATSAVILSATLLPKTWPRLELAALATFAFVPATFNLRLGQMEPVVLLALVLALVAYLRGRQLTCGVLIGLAASLKLAPLVLIVLLVRRRWWRGALASVATVAATVGVGALALGTGPLVEYATRVVPAFAREDGWLYNQSLGGVVNRLADHSVLTIEPSILPLAAIGVALGACVFAITAALTSCQERSSAARAMEYACGVVGMLLIGSITWYLHFVLLLIPFFCAAGYLAAGEARRPRALVVALAACLVTTGVAGAFLTDAPFVNTLVAQHGSWTWWPLLQVTSLPALGVAGLFLVAAADLGVRRQRHREVELPTARRGGGIGRHASLRG